MTIDELSWPETGLLPAVIQHARSGQVLMLGYVNREALHKTLETGHAWFYSRSRRQLWQKGETSGNVLDVRGLRVDCDADALIYLCEPHGPTCHTGRPSCFFQALDGQPSSEVETDGGAAVSSAVETDGEAAEVLWQTIRQRQQQGEASTSYVARLLGEGVDRIGKKIGEEATEVVIAAKNGDRAELAHEVADLWFHTFVLLAAQGLEPSDVWAELRQRRR
jgi:phosphoribosyl-AMP cyclohydrolase / phosphoribosyl-ATP pyrophosphohydrolase